MKAKFGSSVRSKSEVGQVNEVLAKVLCHNICVLIRVFATARNVQVTVKITHMGDVLTSLPPLYLPRYSKQGWGKRDEKPPPR